MAPCPLLIASTDTKFVVKILLLPGLLFLLIATTWLAIDIAHKSCHEIL
jgi:hypothetical protein